MTIFENRQTQDGLTLKLRRGERMCLLGMDVDAPEPDFVGFAIDVKSPGGDYVPLRNRIAFDYAAAAQPGPNGYRNYDSHAAPFQTFRWIHFPYLPQPGTYGYRVTKRHMKPDGSLVDGAQVALDIPLDPVCYPDFLDIGFTRNFASSQAFDERYPDPALRAQILPQSGADRLALDKSKVLGPDGQPSDVFQWLGFEAYQLLFDFLDQAVADPTVTVDALAFDLDEADVVRRLEALGPRLRIVIDNSASHLPASKAESLAAARLAASAGADHVTRHHFQRLQHNKVLIARRGGQPFKVLCGSTNFSYRGLYIQANNMLVFSNADVAGLFGRMFDLAFQGPDALGKDPLSKAWQVVSPDNGPPVHLCFSPHADAALSLGPVAGAIDQAASSVLYSVAFLSLDKTGLVRKALDRLMGRPLFSYGVVNQATGLQVTKPDGSTALVDFAYLAAHAPPPFSAEWSGGAGIHIHHKFIVTDFNLPSAKLFTGSSNLAVGGEQSNGDHLIQISDPLIASAYAIEALRMFDHLHFRTKMQAAGAAATGPITLAKPPAAGRPAWWAPFYVDGSQKARDRTMFSS